MKDELYESFLSALQIGVWFALAASIAFNILLMDWWSFSDGMLKVYKDSCSLEQIKK